jgi:hypothetical protein
MSPNWEAHKELAAGARRSLLTRAQAILVFATAIVTPLACGGLCAAAILVPAPVGVVPLVALCCVGCPMFAAWQIPSALDTLRLRSRRAQAAALAELRRGLAQLPEIDHPLGL